MNPRSSSFPGLALGSLLLLQCGLASAEKSYWRLDDMDDVDLVIDTSWVFLAALAEFHPSNFYVYDSDDGSLHRYSSDAPDAAPDTIIPYDEEASYKLEPRLMDKRLRLLLSDGRKNIAFLTFKPLKNEDAFRSALVKEHDFIEREIEDAVEDHPSIAIEPTDTRTWPQVNLGNLASLRVPADRFYIHRTKDSVWELYDLTMEIKSMISQDKLSPRLTLSTVPPEQDTRYTLYNKDSLKIATHGTFDPFERQAATGDYRLSRRIPRGDGAIYLQSTDMETLDDLPLLAAIAGSVETGPRAEGISITDYVSDTLQSEPSEHIVDLVGKAAAYLPEGYEAEAFDCNQWNAYGFELTEDMTFSCDIPDSHYVAVEDINDEVTSQFDRPRGGFYIRQGKQLTYDQTEAQDGEWLTVLLENDNGFVYYMRNDWHFVRHARIGDTHVIYYMNFNDDLAGCLREFQRSENAIRARPSDPASR